MGFKLSYVAVKGRSEEEILKQFSLQTKESNSGYDAVYSGHLVGAALLGGWYLILDPTFKLVKRIDELRLLSAAATVLTCSIVETTNFSNASEWRDGVCVWNVENNCDNYPETALTVKGEPPPSFDRLRIAADEEAGGNGDEEKDEEIAWEDMMFSEEGHGPNYVDIPSELVAEICQYKYGNNLILESTATKILLLNS